MDWINRETQNKTIESYNAAMDKMLAVSSRVEPEGNSRGTAFPTEYRQLIATNSWQEPATSLWITADSLLDMGRPIRISEGAWIWQSSFFKVRVRMGCPFEVFRQAPGTAAYPEIVDEEAGAVFPGRDAIPSKIVSRSQAISLKLIEKGWGLKDWWAKHEEIEHFMDGANADLLEEWAAKISETDIRVKEYEESVSAKPLTPER